MYQELFFGIDSSANNNGRNGFKTDGDTSTLVDFVLKEKQDANILVVDGGDTPTANLFKVASCDVKDGVDIKMGLPLII